MNKKDHFIIKAKKILNYGILWWQLKRGEQNDKRNLRIPYKKNSTRDARNR